VNEHSYERTPCVGICGITFPFNDKFHEEWTWACLDIVDETSEPSPWCLIGFCCNPTFGRVWGWHSHSWNGDFGSPPGLPKFQSSIVGVKTPRLEAFFISLERYQSVDVENGLAWAIWTFPAQVMAKRRARGQTNNLILDH
jgi:hypothetical protein